MSYDITTATARVPGGSNAALIQTAFDTALAVAERYCDRQFLYAADKATFVHPFASALQLSRYPLEQIVTVTGDNSASITDYHMEAGTGRVVLDSWAHGHQIKIGRQGLIAACVVDLELALWMVFDTIWAQVSSPGGGGAAAGGISSVSIPDVGTLRFDTGATPVSGGAGMGGLIPSMAESILDLYRLKSC